MQLRFDSADRTELEAEALDIAMLATWREKLAVLPDAQRDAVVLRHVVGLTYKELAAATDRPEGTAKADVSRGLATLRRTLSEEELT